MELVTIETIIETLLRQKIGLDASSIGSRTIARSVERRQAICGLPSKSSYLHRLQTSPQELEALIEAVVVPETWFFRDKEPFVCLSQYVKTEWKPNSSGVLRVLSVPCSTGEEPYSIAITLLDSGLTPTQFCIDAVDISKQALLKAKLAIYSRKSFRGGSLQAGRYFQEIENGCEVRPFVRETVNFMHGNILKPSFLSARKYQIIFCRNLLIYLESKARIEALQALDYALAPRGLLFVGSAETSQIAAQHYTSLRHPAAFAYRKENRAAAVKQDAIAPASLVNSHFEPSARTQSKPISSQVKITISELEKAKQLADRGHLTEAAALCESYLSANRTNSQAYILLGEIYQVLNYPELAEQCFQKAIYLNPHAIDALIHLALLKEQRGDFAGANVLRARVKRVINMQK